VAWERRQEAPLVDLRLLRTQAAANTAMLVAGVGMYLLLTLLSRYAQTPRAAGYGFGLSVFEAGLILVPFSVLGFVGGRMVTRLSGRVPLRALLGGGALVVLLACVLFAVGRQVLLSMSVLGLGVGAFSAAMPAALLATTPAGETSSAMSVNQVVRSVGFSLGSAVGGLVLAGATPVGRLFPAESGYVTAAWIGAAAMLITAVIAAFLGSRAAADTAR
jgi:predicted MFS family arabinose efflux permease